MPSPPGRPPLAAIPLEYVQAQGGRIPNNFALPSNAQNPARRRVSAKANKPVTADVTSAPVVETTDSSFDLEAHKENMLATFNDTTTPAMHSRSTSGGSQDTKDTKITVPTPAAASPKEQPATTSTTLTQQQAPGPAFTMLFGELKFECGDGRRARLLDEEANENQDTFDPIFEDPAIISTTADPIFDDPAILSATLSADPSAPPISGIREGNFTKIFYGKDRWVRIRHDAPHPPMSSYHPVAEVEPVVDLAALFAVSVAKDNSLVELPTTVEVTPVLPAPMPVSIQISVADAFDAVEDCPVPESCDVMEHLATQSSLDVMGTAIYNTIHIEAQGFPEALEDSRAVIDDLPDVDVPADFVETSEAAKDKSLDVVQDEFSDLEEANVVSDSGDNLVNDQLELPKDVLETESLDDVEVLEQSDDAISEPFSTSENLAAASPTSIAPVLDTSRLVAVSTSAFLTGNRVAWADSTEDDDENWFKDIQRQIAAGGNIFQQRQDPINVAQEDEISDEQQEEVYEDVEPVEEEAYKEPEQEIAYEEPEEEVEEADEEITRVDNDVKIPISNYRVAGCRRPPLQPSTRSQSIEKHGNASLEFFHPEIPIEDRTLKLCRLAGWSSAERDEAGNITIYFENLRDLEQNHSNDRANIVKKYLHGIPQIDSHPEFCLRELAIAKAELFLPGPSPRPQPNNMTLNEYIWAMAFPNLCADFVTFTLKSSDGGDFYDMKVISRAMEYAAPTLVGTPKFSFSQSYQDDWELHATNVIADMNRRFCLTRNTVLDMRAMVQPMESDPRWQEVMDEVTAESSRKYSKQYVVTLPNEVREHQVQGIKFRRGYEFAPSKYICVKYLNLKFPRGRTAADFHRTFGKSPLSEDIVLVASGKFGATICLPADHWLVSQPPREPEWCPGRQKYVSYGQVIWVPDYTPVPTRPDGYNPDAYMQNSYYIDGTLHPEVSDAEEIITEEDTILVQTDDEVVAVCEELLAATNDDSELFFPMDDFFEPSDSGFNESDHDEDFIDDVASDEDPLLNDTSSDHEDTTAINEDTDVLPLSPAVTIRRPRQVRSMQASSQLAADYQTYSPPARCPPLGYARLHMNHVRLFEDLADFGETDDQAEIPSSPPLPSSSIERPDAPTPARAAGAHRPSFFTASLPDIDENGQHDGQTPADHDVSDDILSSSPFQDTPEHLPLTRSEAEPLAFTLCFRPKPRQDENATTAVAEDKIFKSHGSRSSFSLADEGIEVRDFVLEVDREQIFADLDVLIADVAPLLPIMNEDERGQIADELKDLVADLTPIPPVVSDIEVGDGSLVPPVFVEPEIDGEISALASSIPSPVFSIFSDDAEDNFMALLFAEVLGYAQQSEITAFDQQEDSTALLFGDLLDFDEREDPLTFLFGDLVAQDLVDMVEQDNTSVVVINTDDLVTEQLALNLLATLEEYAIEIDTFQSVGATHDQTIDPLCTGLADVRAANAPTSECGPLVPGAWIEDDGTVVSDLDDGHELNGLVYLAGLAIVAASLW